MIDRRQLVYYSVFSYVKYYRCTGAAAMASNILEHKTGHIIINTTVKPKLVIFLYGTVQQSKNFIRLVIMHAMKVSKTA